MALVLDKKIMGEEGAGMTLGPCTQGEVAGAWEGVVGGGRKLELLLPPALTLSQALAQGFPPPGSPLWFPLCSEVSAALSPSMFFSLLSSFQLPFSDGSWG